MDTSFCPRSLSGNRRKRTLPLKESGENKIEQKYSRLILSARSSQVRFTDERGFFQELYHTLKYPQEVKPEDGIPQVSLSHSRRGVIRGIHRSLYAKMVTVVNGAIYDVVVDLRHDSPTFRRWCAVILSSHNMRQLHIPAGCGHAFLCLEDADVLYLQSGCFHPPNEIDVNVFDNVLDIHWPELRDVKEYIMSEKDKNAPGILDVRLFKEILPRTISPLDRVLVVGASGQVGGALLEAFGPENVVGTYSTTPCPGMVHFDLKAAATDPQVVDDLMTMCRPRVVCICAGRTWVDGCENEGDLPKLVNCDGPAAVARAAKKIGAKTVYYSTDYIFDGREPHQLYREEDEALPLNVYGLSKLQGEKSVLAEDSTCLVLRTTGVFGPEKHGKNFVYQLCNAICDKREIKCPIDSFGSPTYSRDLARMTVGLLGIGAVGVFHCVGPETLNRHEFALKIANSFNLDSTWVKSTSLEELCESTKQRLGFSASRGKHLGLSIEKTLSHLPKQFHPRPVEEALQHWKANPRGADCKF